MSAGKEKEQRGRASRSKRKEERIKETTASDLAIGRLHTQVFFQYRYPMRKKQGAKPLLTCSSKTQDYAEPGSTQGI